ncbi:Tp4 [Theileria parva strain Muguga]|uniref:T-complex protein 1 subunit eta n=2 Tax=Theileria parva TaxID=5875 RepID=Q4N0D4_THEPA|nr:T-complex protein 1 subunit eta [Theileria parva strain Muguga]EAN30945.1 Tp4 [Theileria parva strain Muguga]|eukprot:XP_763228.1 T-complex protein 1 subunit eta [Theileria parva strain Muguga]
MSHLMNLPILVLKEGTDTSQGQAQIISNINACQAIVDCVKTTLGPRGMDKLIHTERDVTITNDGATVLKLLDITHPAASVLVDIAKSQDDEVGDGTTSVTVLAGELLNEAKAFILDGISPQVIIKYYREACQVALNLIDKVAIHLSNKSSTDKKELLIKCAETTFNSKLLSGYKTFFAKMVVEAVATLDEDLDEDMIGVKKVTGGSCEDSLLVKGVAFKKTFSYAGAEQQPKKFVNPKILLLNLELELKSEKENAEIVINNPQEYQKIIDAEYRIIFEKLENAVKLGANVVLSKLPIGDLATQYFADKNVFCAGRVDENDLIRTSKATGASIQTTLNNLSVDVLGTCGVFEEVQIGSERYNMFTDCKSAKTCTIVLRGGGQQFIDESERSLHDAIMIVRRATKCNTILPGAGAIEMLLSTYLLHYSLNTINPTDSVNHVNCVNSVNHVNGVTGVNKSLVGKRHIIMNGFAKALECIPRNLATNSGYNSNDLLSILRNKYNQLEIVNGEIKVNNEESWYGIDCYKGSVCNAYKACIWEPSLVKKNSIYSATEAACLVLSVDETVKNQSRQQLQSALPQPK